MTVTDKQYVTEISLVLQMAILLDHVSMINQHTGSSYFERGRSFFKTNSAFTYTH